MANKKYLVELNCQPVEIEELPNGHLKLPKNIKESLNGYSGFQPKPAVEVVIVAMKPLEERTYVDQALKNGHGCTWLDDARIPFESESDVGDKHQFTKAYSQGDGHEGWKRKAHDTYNPPIVGHSKGRFPANVLCEDDVLNDGLERKSGGRKGERNINWWASLTNTNNPPSIVTSCTKDEGSFSRYFSLDAWFAERIKLLPKEAQKTFPWLIVPKASKSEKNQGLEDMPLKEHHILDPRPCDSDPNNKRAQYVMRQPTQNNHPTCKPIKLMSWLITLASREGDIILDPFVGSGTTSIAAKTLNRKYIGIELEHNYVEIAKKRIQVVPKSLFEFDRSPKK